MRKQPNETSHNQHRYDHRGEGNGRHIHNVLIGCASAGWMLSHLNTQFNGKWPPS
jgi:hypothetical protein